MSLRDNLAGSGIIRLIRDLEKIQDFSAGHVPRNGCVTRRECSYIYSMRESYYLRWDDDVANKGAVSVSE